MNSIFSIENSDLANLSPERAVKVFGELLWAEATVVGVPTSLINVPSSITVADGGIDAEIRDVQINGGQGIIKLGLTRYQIKSGAFDLTESSIKKILFVHGKSELKPRIKSCLDNNGTLIIVFFAWDNPDRTDDQCRNEFIEVLKIIDAKYANANVEIWRQNNLCGFFKPYVSLTLKIKGQDKTRFHSHDSWSRQQEMRCNLELGEEQRIIIEEVRTELRKTDGSPIHIRILGEPGVGKTKLILEATAVHDLAPVVIYCDSASKFRDSDLMNELLREDNAFQVLLVIDECDPNSRANIADRLMPYCKRIRLVSIYNENDNALAITYIDIPLLGSEQISNIIQSYNIPKDQASRWVEFCSGSPRVAHAFGQSLKNNPDDLLRPPATVDLWERYIVGGDDPSSQAVQQRRVVLRHLALFKRFGYEQPYQTEAKAIWGIVQKADSQITWLLFNEIICTLRRRKILQGEISLYITPKALHIKLWTDWWQNYGRGDGYIETTCDLPKLLQQWSNEMFVYARESEVASRAVKELLGERGPFLR